jgi:hypothetical protein
MKKILISTAIVLSVVLLSCGKEDIKPTSPEIKNGGLRLLLGSYQLREHQNSMVLAWSRQELCNSLDHLNFPLFAHRKANKRLRKT